MYKIQSLAREYIFSPIEIELAPAAAAAAASSSLRCVHFYFHNKTHEC